MRKIILILVIFNMASCNNDDDNKEKEVYDGDEMDTYVDFSIFDSQGNDLLDMDNANAIVQEEIKLFYVIDGNETEFYQANLDYPRNYFVYENDGNYRIRIFANNAESEARPITYIQWAETDRDTLEVVYDRPANSVLKNQIWLNGEEIWERGDNTIDAYFQLEK